MPLLLFLEVFLFRFLAFSLGKIELVLCLNPSLICREKSDENINVDHLLAVSKSCKSRHKISTDSFKYVTSAISNQ